VSDAQTVTLPLSDGEVAMQSVFVLSLNQH
jgi:hypothetical protein